MFSCRMKRRETADLLNGVDVGLVAGECLDGFASPDIPDLCGCIACSRHKEIGIRCERDANPISI
jgi:hypothetical protein